MCPSQGIPSAQGINLGRLFVDGQPEPSSRSMSASAAAKLALVVTEKDHVIDVARNIPGSQFAGDKMIDRVQVNSWPKLAGEIVG